MQVIDYWLSLYGEVQFHDAFLHHWVTGVDAGDPYVGFADAHDVFGLYIAGNEL